VSAEEPVTARIPKAAGQALQLPALAAGATVNSLADQRFFRAERRNLKTKSP
jgi:hypothetical protein